MTSSNVTSQEGNYSDTIYGSCNLGYHTVAGQLEHFNIYCDEFGVWSESYACESKCQLFFTLQWTLSFAAIIVSHDFGGKGEVIASQ